MRAIVLMYDSLNKKYLSSYGYKESITPNFKRLSEKTITFENFYAGSLPCMPARRELHTGRYNFLHRSWGPLEPYDFSMPQTLSDNGIYTHIVTDHCHYWQEGGATYHTRFSSCDFIRGQEGDYWYGKAENFVRNLDARRQDAINRIEMPDEESHPHVRTFQSGMKFLEDNVHSDNWYLQLEYFDPHEPFFVPKKYKDMYQGGDAMYDWPEYNKTDDNKKTQEARCNYMALVTMCDVYLGKILDFMDQHDMWKDTMLIVNTDHGFLLGEHGYFAKNYMPTYNEIAHIPFFMWDPKSGASNCRRNDLAQTIDIPATLSDFFEIPVPGTVLGKSLLPAAKQREETRDYLLFGYFGKHINITDGRYVYMKSAVSDEMPLYNYTLLPLNIFAPFNIKELRNIESKMVKFNFTRDVPLMKIPTSTATAPGNSAYWYSRHREFGDLLFDLQSDPEQMHPIKDDNVTLKFEAEMRRIMAENDAPPEQFDRMGFTR
jgi:arylsulfatase A-like enzyme